MYQLVKFNSVILTALEDSTQVRGHQRHFNNFEKKKNLLNRKKELN